MNYRHATSNCLLCLVVAWGGAHAAADATQAPKTAPTGTNVITISNDDGLGHGKQRVFAQLDQRHKGYLTLDDVDSNAFLRDNFSHCDTNGDARLSRAEVAACLPPDSAGQ
jgi:hypothetical protein